MDSSVRLFAKEEKGKVYPTNTVSFSDSLYLKNQMKTVVDSVNNAKDLQIKKTKY